MITDIEQLNVTNDSFIYFAKLDDWDETGGTISKTIYSPRYSISPQEGDIYWRANPKNNGVFACVFTGKSEKFYDQNFGAGSERHYRNVVDVGVLATAILELGEANKDYRNINCINDYMVKMGLNKVFN